MVGILNPKSKGKDKAYSRWGKGVWLGIREESEETFIVTKEGVIKVNCVRRHADESLKWNLRLFSAFKGISMGTGTGVRIK